MATFNTSSLAQKEAMLKKAEAMVAELRNQVAALRDAEKPSEFEALFASQQPVFPAENPTTSFVAVPTINNTAMKTLNEKNEKGIVSKTILEVLKDGQPKSVEQVMREVNEILDKPTTAGSMRGTLSNLKNANLVIKTAYGKYTVQSYKGESPADVVATNDNGEAFNLQPSPIAGR